MLNKIDRKYAVILVLFFFHSFIFSFTTSPKGFFFSRGAQYIGNFLKNNPEARERGSWEGVFFKHETINNDD